MKSFLGQNNLPRGTRNNNVFNIRINAGNKWLGKIPNGTDKDFEQFTHFEYGIRAFIILMRTYMTGSGNGLPLNTISGIINRFAPASDGNNPTTYIAATVASSGFQANQALGFNKETIRKLAKPFAKMESNYNLTDAEFDEAWSLLGSSVPVTPTTPDVIVQNTPPNMGVPKKENTASIGIWVTGGIALLLFGSYFAKTSK
jgi:hypothetical protein